MITLTEKNIALNYKKIVPQLEDDLNNFDLRQNLFGFRMSKNLNIKRVFYRSITLFVSALGRAYGLLQNSSFEIIEELKRRIIISETAAQRLSLAVAVACHIRLVHYLSKRRQEDNMHKEDEIIGGQKKLKGLKKIVNINWLLKSLVTTMALQECTKMGVNIQIFDNYLHVQEVFLSSVLMLSLGLHHELVRFGETFYQNYSKLNWFQHMTFPLVCYACRCTKQYDKCLRLLNQFRKKFPKLPAEMDSIFESEYASKVLGLFEACNFLSGNEVLSNLRSGVEMQILYIEAECLLDLKQFDVAIEKSNELLKLNLSEEERCVILLSNSICKAKVKQYRESLSSLRDLMKLNQVWDQNIPEVSIAIVPQALQFIAICLFIIGRKEQGLHKAREGLNFFKLTKAVSLYIEHFQRLVETLTTCSPRQFEMIFHGKKYFY